MANYDGALDAIAARRRARATAEQEQQLKQTKKAAKRAQGMTKRQQQRRDKWLKRRAGDKDALDLRLPGSFGTGKR